MMQLSIKYIGLLLLIAGGLFIFKLLMSSPSNQKKWKPQYQVLATVKEDSGNIHIKNLRDFSYHKNGRIEDQKYLDKSYKLEDLKSTWFGISHFAGYGMAHVFLSFEFTNQQYLVVSIEARLTVNDANYQPVKGLFRQYTKAVVLATEQDVIGLRTHIRGENVYLYQLELSASQQRKLLLSNLTMAQNLTSEPDFYNTFMDNCMTGLLAQTNRFSNWTSWLDYRIILPGYADRLGYDIGLIDNSKTLTEIRRKAFIDPAGMSLDDADFSVKIRQ